jgi:arginyl-tRNA synthetase
VQYAHARISAVLAKAGEERVRKALEAIAEGSRSPDDGRTQDGNGAVGGSGTSLHAAERALVKQLLAFPGEVQEAADRRAPHRITAYALQLAQDFTAFYRDCRVLGAEPEIVESLRIALSVATQRTIARCLDLLGVSAPTEM